jgi:hypothetical protein
MTKNQTPTTFEYLDNPFARDIFADAMTGLQDIGGVIRITLEACHTNHSFHPGPINRVCVGRVLMTVDAAENMAEEILRFVEKVRTPQPLPQTSMGRAN